MEEYRMPLIGDKAPEFRAMTTMGKVNFPDDYQGSWVVILRRYAPLSLSVCQEWRMNSPS